MLSSTQIPGRNVLSMEACLSAFARAAQLLPRIAALPRLSALLAAALLLALALFQPSQAQTTPPVPAPRSSSSTLSPLPSTLAPPTPYIPEAEAQTHLIRRIDPAYPDAAAEQNIAGTVQLRITINQTGQVAHIYPISGPELLIAPAAEAVRRWQYSPFLVDDKATEIHTNLHVPFGELAAAAEQQRLLASYRPLWKACATSVELTPANPRAAVSSAAIGPAQHLGVPKPASSPQHPAQKTGLPLQTRPLSTSAAAAAALNPSPSTLHPPPSPSPSPLEACRTAAAVAAQLAPGTAAVERRQSAQFYAIALARAGSFPQTAAWAAKALPLFAEPPPDPAAAATTYLLLAQARAASGDTLAAAQTLAEAESHLRESLASAPNAALRQLYTTALRDSLQFHANLLTLLRNPSAAQQKLHEANAL